MYMYVHMYISLNPAIYIRKNYKERASNENQNKTEIILKQNLKEYCPNKKSHESTNCFYGCIHSTYYAFSSILIIGVRFSCTARDSLVQFCDFQPF